jgi:muramoyltetrapeptide carboxypeptidase
MFNGQCSMKIPPYLQPGDLVTVISPSGALQESAAFQAGLEIWRSHGYRVELQGNYQAQYGYLAGTDAARRAALAEAWENPECKAIVCARGGYGGARLLEDWNWQLQSDRFISKWIVGFSDVTSLLWSLARFNIASLHAPVLTTLATQPELAIARMFACLEGDSIQPLYGNGWGGGQVEGILLPANLTVATHLLGTSLQPSLTGAILALEDVTEYPYRIDRMLTQWRLTGALQQIFGIALGRFSRCEAPPASNSWTVEEVLRDRLQDLNIPIVSDLPFGHDGANAALPVGQLVRLDGETGVLSWVE